MNSFHLPHHTSLVIPHTSLGLGNSLTAHRHLYCVSRLLDSYESILLDNTHSRRHAECPEGQDLKQKQKHPHRSSKRSTSEDPHSWRDKSSDEDLQLKLLTAIHGVSDMLTNWEAPAGESSQAETSSTAPPRTERHRKPLLIGCHLIKSRVVFS